MSDNSIQSFKEKLDKEYEWPSLYTFKFIVPKGKEGEVKSLFNNHDVSEKQSSKGNYISVTAKIMAESSQKVIEYYIAANKIEGIIAL
ncbi:DUF493 domain-containing protein [Fulvivirga sp. RKSG066]|uniref:DUF493 family protein n=1 Tax=Fulvivirga aurantia TaxID=2529383 RepID=UPI0012BCA812|nr:DUF493 family protein [Fulvivirga aurantia]MTI22162.1 DUF493 domain-containing protein [Fulvivirga aurantia]